MNPYQSPGAAGSGLLYSPELARAAAREAVSGPATALLVVAVLALMMALVMIPFNIWLLASGAAEQIDRGGMDPNVVVFVRLIWHFALAGASAYVCWGAVSMKRLANYSGARAAAIVAVIPCLGPCCVLGIPFGIWALNVLGRPEVRSSFES